MKPKDLQHLTDAEIDKKAVEARRAYMRKYRQRPGFKERQKEYNRRYWARKALAVEEANSK